MPTYTFRNKITQEQFEVFLRINEKENYLIENPELEQIIQSPLIVRDVGTNLKVSDTFRERISRIKETYKSNNIPDY